MSVTPDIFPKNSHGEPLARPFLEFTQRNTSKFLDDSIKHHRDGTADPIDGFTSLITLSGIFYSEPFIPENDLIGDNAIFKGWIFGKWLDWYMLGNVGVKLLHDNINYSRIANHEFPKWQSRDEFISDFNRLGEELILTDYAVNLIMKGATR